MQNIKPYPIGEALNMLYEDLVPSFAWFFPQKPDAIKFRKAVTTEMGRRVAANPDKLFTSSLVSTVHSDKVAYFVVITPKTEGEIPNECDL